MENLCRRCDRIKARYQADFTASGTVKPRADKKPKEEKKTVPKTYGGLPYTPPPSDII